MSLDVIRHDAAIGVLNVPSVGVTVLGRAAPRVIVQASTGQQGTPTPTPTPTPTGQWDFSNSANSGLGFWTGVL